MTNMCRPKWTFQLFKKVYVPVLIFNWPESLMYIFHRNRPMFTSLKASSFCAAAYQAASWRPVWYGAIVLFWFDQLTVKKKKQEQPVVSRGEVTQTKATAKRQFSVIVSGLRGRWQWFMHQRHIWTMCGARLMLSLDSCYDTWKCGDMDV